MIDDLREPLEKKRVTLVRQGETYIFPADFLLVAATNPCKCGFYGDDERACTCTEYQVRKYQSKLSGPVLDRIDMHLRLTKVRYEELKAEPGLNSTDMREMVRAARERQRKRYLGEVKLNADLDASETERYVILDEECEGLLRSAYISLKLDPRTLLKTKKIARTIADVEGHEEITAENVAEALGYREQELRRGGAAAW